MKITDISYVGRFLVFSKYFENRGFEDEIERRKLKWWEFLLYKKEVILLLTQYKKIILKY